MIEYIRFMIAANTAYKNAKKSTNKCHYVGVTSEYGVPFIAIFIGLGRDAWRVTHQALESGLLR